MDPQQFFGIPHSDLKKANLNVYGLGWDRSSTYRRGASSAPSVIRAATTGKLYNCFTETMVNLQERWSIYDAGDINIVNELSGVYANLLKIIRQVPKDDRKHLFLGGDHIITYLTIKALRSNSRRNWGLLYFDSHPDLYPNYHGDRYSHACVVRRIIDEGLIPSANILEVGIRAATAEQITYAQDQRLKIISTLDIFAKGAQNIGFDILEFFSKKIENIYLSIDLDILDPAFAPGVGNPESGGISTRTLVEILHGISTLDISAFDIVELCPPFDPSNITSFSAAKIIKEILGILNIPKLVSGRRDPYKKRR
jgi:agmatinase